MGMRREIIYEDVKKATIEPVLNIDGIRFSYPDNPDVLKGINLKVLPGQRVGLIGPNGAGKTTLFLVVSGILKPNTGIVSLLGKPIEHGKFNPQVALVFQNPDDQLFCPSVRDDVAFGLQNMGLPKEEVKSKVDEALRTVGASAFADRPAHHLSEGEKRIVSIASVLVMHPYLILYDEPSANLDIRSRRRLIHLLQSSSETNIVASHDLELILEVCDRVILVDDGEIIADGNPIEIMSNKELMEAHGQEKPHSLIPHQRPHHYIGKSSI
jgi:cobalt/nickel transport system ATP-binding protein